jgi:hypothetical protein
MGAARAEARRRAAGRGFTLPLTIVLTFSLMSLATAIVGLVVVNDRAARSAGRDLSDLATLESGANAALFAVERDGAPIANSWPDAAVYNGRDVRVLLAPTRYKPDIDRDPAVDAAAVLTDADLHGRVLQALTPPPAPVAAGEKKAAQAHAAYPRFIDFAQAAHASPAEEDCLRQRLTLGRKAAKPEPRLPETALIPQRSPLVAGDVLDVRASTGDGHGGEQVLWLRARYAGLPGQSWLVQDWRRLHVAPDAPGCAPLPGA